MSKNRPLYVFVPKSRGTKLLPFNMRLCCSHTICWIDGSLQLAVFPLSLEFCLFNFWYKSDASFWLITECRVNPQKRSKVSFFVLLFVTTTSSSESASSCRKKKKERKENMTQKLVIYSSTLMLSALLILHFLAELIRIYQAAAAAL